MANIELLDQVIAKIEAEPETWDQDTWGRADVFDETTETACGTAYCVAGHVSIMTGAKPMWRKKVESYWDNEAQEFKYREYWYFNDVQAPDGRFRSVEGYASDQLELDYGDANRLFHHANSFDDIKEMRNMLANGEDLREYEYADYDVVDIDE